MYMIQRLIRMFTGGRGRTTRRRGGAGGLLSLASRFLGGGRRTRTRF